MIKLYLCTIILSVPCLGYADELKDLNPPRRLNLEISSTNTCSRQEATIHRREGPYLYQTSYIYQRDVCREVALPVWEQANFANNEVTTWLRLKGGHSHDTRMIGLGFRFQVAGAGVAHIRVRGGGGIQFRYRTTF